MLLRRGVEIRDVDYRLEISYNSRRSASVWTNLAISQRFGQQAAEFNLSRGEGDERVEEG